MQRYAEYVDVSNVPNSQTVFGAVFYHKRILIYRYASDLCMLYYTQKFLSRRESLYFTFVKFSQEKRGCSNVLNILPVFINTI